MLYVIDSQFGGDNGELGSIVAITVLIIELIVLGAGFLFIITLESPTFY